MRRETTRAAVALCSITGLIGCGGGGTEPSPTTYENIAGVYTANVTGTLPGNTLNAALTLTLQQASASLSGGYLINASVNGGFPGSGSVNLTGTVASGPNPAVNFTVTSQQCPASTPANWTGSFQNSSGSLTMNGTIHLLNQSCITLLSFPVTALFTK